VSPSIAFDAGTVSAFPAGQSSSALAAKITRAHSVRALAFPANARPHIFTIAPSPATAASLAIAAICESSTLRTVRFLLFFITSSFLPTAAPNGADLPSA
jgi:hypothetical protein